MSGSGYFIFSFLISVLMFILNIYLHDIGGACGWFVAASYIALATFQNYMLGQHSALERK
jgi:hypothetical protein